MAKKITRKEESEIPLFEDHAKAREWFIKKYGDDFIPETSQIIGDEICYYYNLILDWETFHAERRKLYEGRMRDAMAFLNSYQSIQITSDGSVHIVH